MPDTAPYAFATVEQFTARTGRTFSVEQKPQIEELLADATEFLRSNLGLQFSPPRHATVTYHSKHIDLPAFTTSVLSVTRGGKPVSGWSWDGATVTIPGEAEPADVTFVFGLDKPPREIVRWTIVLVSQALTTLELGLGLGAGGISSVQIDDFRAAFADGGASTGIAMSDAALNRLRRQFGGDGVSGVDLR